MNNLDLENSAFPTFQNDVTMSTGLSKREWFAGLAMQGLMASDTEHELSIKDCTDFAIKTANNMIKELNK